KTQEKLLVALESINKRFKDFVAVKFSVTLGDEFQGLLSGIEKSYDICRAIEKDLYPVKISFGVGVGNVSTNVARRTSQMDGKCFVRSRGALEKAKEEGQSIVFLSGGYSCLPDLPLNTIVMLVDTIKQSWKDIHYRRVWRYEELKTLEAVARREKVSFQMIDKSLKAARHERILTAEINLRRILAAKTRSTS
ncbi:MAG: SatD family protein, partial [Endomicrobiia bacterium]|nr:SatD family protein [Endomicrobiia bacterium]